MDFDMPAIIPERGAWFDGASHIRLMNANNNSALHLSNTWTFEYWLKPSQGDDNERMTLTAT